MVQMQASPPGSLRGVSEGKRRGETGRTSREGRNKREGREGKIAVKKKSENRLRKGGDESKMKK